MSDDRIMENNIEKIEKPFKIEIDKNGRIAYDPNMQLVPELSVNSEQFGYKRNINYRHRLSFCGSDVLTIINDKILLDIVDKVSFKYMENDLTINISTPIFSDSDDQYELLRSRTPFTLTQLYLNEYGKHVVRKFNDLSYAGENGVESVNSILISNEFILKSIKKPTNFKTLSDAELIEQYGNVIKKVGTGQYVQK